MPLAASNCTDTYQRTFLAVGSVLPIDPFVWYHPTIMIPTPLVPAPPRTSIQIEIDDDPGAFHPSLGLVHSPRIISSSDKLPYRIALLRLLGTTLTLQTQYRLYPTLLSAITPIIQI